MTHDEELAKYGQITSASSESGSLVLLAGGLAEAGWLTTDKG